MMKLLVTILLLGWHYVSPVLSLPTTTDSWLFHGRSSPTLPTDDPFYTPPSGFETVSPGTILRYRTPPYPISAFGLSPVQLEASYQILYRTTDSFGNAASTVSTILVPENADYTKLVSYQVAEDAAYPNCAPSYGFQFGSSSTGGVGGEIVTELEIILIETLLKQGWVVTVPDHLGPKATFLANLRSGYSTLDNIRAAIASSSFTGLSSSPTIAMWGYSGGSLATGFAAELQPTYAPELEIAGAVLGGTVPQIYSAMLTLNEGAFVGLVPAGILGLSNEYPAIASAVNGVLIPSKQAEFDKASTLCLAADVLEYIGQDIFSYVNDSSIFTEPSVTAVLNENNMGNRIPEIPLLVYKSINDEVSLVNETDALVEQYCNAGANVEYKRDYLSDHATMAILGVPDALLWLQDRFDGVAVTSGCSTTSVFTSLTDLEADLVLGSVLITTLLDLLGAPSGPFIG